MTTTPAPTPMMAQYLALKAESEDCLLFYRMGDFFELFFDDARVAAQVLDIALTSRGEHAGEKIPMCGVPVHAATAYLQRLIKAGHRVAIAEQTESPEAARKARGSKALVNRAIVRVVTAGTLTEETLLDARAANQVTDFLVGLFEVASPDKAGGKAVTAREMLDEGAVRVRRELTDAPVVRARLLNAMGGAYMGMRQDAAAEALPVGRFQWAMRTSAGVLGSDAVLLCRKTSCVCFSSQVRRLHLPPVRTATGVASIAVATAHTPVASSFLPLTA